MKIIALLKITLSLCKAIENNQILDFTDPYSLPYSPVAANRILL